MSSYKTLTLKDSGIHFAYLDSGAPPNPSYGTFITSHGIGFNARVFEKAIDLASASSIRIVAISRRDYPGTSPLTPEEAALATSEGEEEKSRYVSERGLEILEFADRFIQENNIPAVSGNGEAGGVVLLGWSLGCSFPLAALGNASKLAEEKQARLSKYIRGLILDDPPAPSVGKPWPATSWFPTIDPSIPAEERLPISVAWLTGYFKHDLSKRGDRTALTSVSFSTHRVPSIYSMHSNYSEMINLEALVGSEGPHVAGVLAGPLTECYEKVLFGKEIRVIFPHLKIWHFARAEASMFGIDVLWHIQDDDKKHGGGYVHSELVPGTNHLASWDDPQIVINNWKKALA